MVAVIERLVADIDRARRHVRILVYIFADDVTGRKIISALGRAAERGVPCQVMIDAVGSDHWIRNTMRLLREAGVEVHEALPFRLFHGFTRRDMRNHRKLFVIDGEIGFAGSQKIVDKDFRPGVINRELVARVTGPVVTEMEATIRGDWYLETGMLPEAVVGVPPRSGEASVGEECRFQQPRYPGTENAPIDLERRGQPRPGYPLRRLSLRGSRRKSIWTRLGVLAERHEIADAFLSL